MKSIDSNGQPFSKLYSLNNGLKRISGHSLFIAESFPEEQGTYKISATKSYDFGRFCTGMKFAERRKGDSGFSFTPRFGEAFRHKETYPTVQGFLVGR